MQHRILAALLVTFACAPVAVAQQVADSSYTPVVAVPAFPFKSPRVLLDEAHNNFHTLNGRYKPFVELLRADGVTVMPNLQPFTLRRLKGYDVLVIANAVGPGVDADSIAKPAFSERECQIVEQWVRRGGALLLIADHAPFGAAAENLSLKFGVGMSKGFTVDSLHTDPELGSPSILIYSRGNERLRDHPITNGRDSTERVERVIAFTGQSLAVPAGATAFLELSEMAVDMPATLRQFQGLGVMPAGRPAAGRAQGVAFQHGRGRVVILGEAAMLSAQILFSQRPDGTPAEPYRMGMNRPGIDNQQLALNIVRWLVGLL
jgi:hypothetical protein